MSQRHRSVEAAPPPKMDLRAHAHNERHRINSELQRVAATVSSGTEPDDVDEPGRAWVMEHRRDAERAKATSGRQRKRHWKMKDWKRRTAQRRAKAQAMMSLAKQY
jgi:hypothetical protein